MPIKNQNDERRKESLLIFKAAIGHSEEVKQLIREGVNINHRNADGDSALFRSCIGGHKGLALELLALGAFPHAVSNDGISILMVACMNGLKDVVTTLLEAGVNINYCSEAGNAFSVAYGQCYGLSSDIFPSRLQSLSSSLQPFREHKLPIFNDILKQLIEAGVDIQHRFLEKGGMGRHIGYQNYLRFLNGPLITDVLGEAARQLNQVSGDYSNQYFADKSCYLQEVVDIIFERQSSDNPRSANQLVQMIRFAAELPFSRHERVCWLFSDTMGTQTRARHALHALANDVKQRQDPAAEYVLHYADREMIPGSEGERNDLVGCYMFGF